MPETAWGDDSRYYSAAEPSAGDFAKGDAAGVTKRLSHLLRAHDPATEPRILSAVKQWNPVLREQLRRDMGLRLTVRQDTAAVPVRVEDGLPSPLAGVIGRLEP